MTQYCVVWKVATTLLEGVDVVDTFANKGAFAEEILIDIRYNSGVWIDA